MSVGDWVHAWAMNADVTGEGSNESNGRGTRAVKQIQGENKGWRKRSARIAHSEGQKEEVEEEEEGRQKEESRRSRRSEK